MSAGGLVVAGRAGEVDRRVAPHAGLVRAFVDAGAESR
jgi:hypothetical protein